MVRLGIESVLESQNSVLADDRLGLITNPSGVDSELRTTIDLLADRDEFDLRKLFGPEHGIRGSEQAGVEVEDSIDEKTGLPVKSLYGEEKHLRPEMIADLDTVVYDMQDIGCRFYTLIYTLAYALEGVAAAGKRMVVLDRPNPIAPVAPAGNRVPDAHSSFVGNYGLPIVHGMTVGELATYFNDEFDIGADLHVVELDDWDVLEARARRHRGRAGPRPRPRRLRAGSRRTHDAHLGVHDVRRLRLGVLRRRVLHRQARWRHLPP